jgi:hypothetical protein
MNESKLVHYVDSIDLSSGRKWVLLWSDPPNRDEPPRIWIEEFHEDAKMRKKLRREYVTGRVWCYPDDIARVVRTLTYLRDLFQKPTPETDKEKASP